MIHTVYSNERLIRDVLASVGNSEQAVTAAAVLSDLGLTVCETEAEFQVLVRIIPAHLVFAEYRHRALLHGRVDVLPETDQAQAPVPHFDISSNGQLWKRSNALWSLAIRNGWVRHVPGFLRTQFGKSCPWYLSAQEFAIAWRTFSHPPSDKSKLN